MSGRAPGIPTRSMSVSTEPGQTALTAMPSARSSCGQRARQPDDAVLGGAVGGEPGRPLPPGDRRDVDDAAAAAGAHRRQKGARHEEGALEVRVDDGVPALERRLVEPGARDDAGVVDEDVGRAEPLAARRRRSARRRRGGRRRRRRRPAAAWRAQPATFAPASASSAGDGAADPARGAGHDGDLARERAGARAVGRASPLIARAPRGWPPRAGAPSRSGRSRISPTKALVTTPD